MDFFFTETHGEHVQYADFAGIKIGFRAGTRDEIDNGILACISIASAVETFSQGLNALKQFDGKCLHDKRGKFLGANLIDAGTYVLGVANVINQDQVDKRITTTYDEDTLGAIIAAHDQGVIPIVGDSVYHSLASDHSQFALGGSHVMTGILNASLFATHFATGQSGGNKVLALATRTLKQAQRAFSGERNSVFAEELSIDPGRDNSRCFIDVREWKKSYRLPTVIFDKPYDVSMELYSEYVTPTACIYPLDVLAAISVLYPFIDRQTSRLYTAPFNITPQLSRASFDQLLIGTIMSMTDTPDILQFEVFDMPRSSVTISCNKEKPASIDAAAIISKAVLKGASVTACGWENLNVLNFDQALVVCVDMIQMTQLYGNSAVLRVMGEPGN